MNYQTYAPHPDLSAIVKFYWTLEVPFDPNNQKQKIIPDGCIEMTFNFKDKIKRYTSDEDYILHPDAMIMGQRTKSYFIEPLGDVDTFAICFYPFGFTNFVSQSLDELVDIEKPISELFNAKAAQALEDKMRQANTTSSRIEIIESFLRHELHQKNTLENLVESTVSALLASNGKQSIREILDEQNSQRRQLERKFRKQIGISPKQLAKVLRLQAALKMMLNQNSNLTEVAYENEYFDQAHFIKNFKEFIGISPKEFLNDEQMALSKLFYK